MFKILLIAAGGALGSLVRFYTANIFPFENNQFPKGTFLVNIFASLLLGLVTGLLFYKFPNNSYLKYFLAIGFCGGYSTFSTFALDIYNLQNTASYSLIILYALGSVFISVIFIWAGVSIVKLTA